MHEDWQMFTIGVSDNINLINSDEAIDLVFHGNDDGVDVEHRYTLSVCNAKTLAKALRLAAKMVKDARF